MTTQIKDYPFRADGAVESPGTGIGTLSARVADAGRWLKNAEIHPPFG